ncbi:set and mynd domain-containing protein 3 [Moniliophthora roreri MCA 2997]|uniref:Set and mynd domain-containing protein 3 n=1 Tax=Moniliophthora roreri (strain MCA 2997) TaxID=1381753 RepID=V2XTV2_MONRO|nr:set and mynd domain-containing protein 3 [Moniliophthora roreri MCA 2997]
MNSHNSSTIWILHFLQLRAVLILCDFFELPDLTTRSGLKKVHANFDAIVRRLDQVYNEHGDNEKIAGGIVGIYAKMCADSILRNKLFQRGFLSKLLPLLDKPYSQHMALRSLSSVAHHGSDIVHTELAKLTPTLLRLLNERPDDPKVAELVITIMSHSIVGVVSKHISLTTHTPYRPSYLKIRTILDATIKQLKNPAASRYLIDHAITLLAHLAYHYGPEIKADKSVVNFFIAGLRNKNWEFRCQCLSGIIRMHLHEDEDDTRSFDPNIYLEIAQKRWPDNLVNVFYDYGQPRTDMYIRMTTQRDFQKALMAVASSRDLYAFGLTLYDLILRTEWAIADGLFQEQDPRTGKKIPMDSAVLGLPFQRYPDALPHCANAIRAKGNPDELDKADVLDIKYLIMKQRVREAADFARKSLQRNPDFAYYYYAISLTADRVEGLKASKKGLKCKQTSPFVRHQLIQRAVEHAGDYGLGTLNEAGSDQKKWEEGVALLMSALDDSKLFVKEAPPDNHRMRNVLYWNILLGILVRGPEVSADLREIKSSLSKLKFTDEFTQFIGLRPPNTALRLAQETVVKRFESAVGEWHDIIANMEGPDEKPVDPEKAEDDLAAWLDDMKLDNGERETLIAHPKVNANHVALYQCSWCHNPSAVLRKCSGCGQTRYCDSGCQKQHWSEHKKKCKEASGKAES